jgi:Family of unknown function (DUF5681)
MSARPEEELEGPLEKTETAKEYQVGYGRPPTQSQFKKGRSGNPTGRRRYTESERAQQLLREEGARVLTLRQGNRVEKITAVRAAVRSLFLEAAKGKTAAQKMVLQLVAAQSKPPENNEKPTKLLDRAADAGLKMLTDSELAELERLVDKAWPSGPS